MGKSTISMVIFNSYVKLPEGMQCCFPHASVSSNMVGWEMPEPNRSFCWEKSWSDFAASHDCRVFTNIYIYIYIPWIFHEYSMNIPWIFHDIPIWIFDISCIISPSYHHCTTWRPSPEETTLSSMRAISGSFRRLEAVSSGVTMAWWPVW